MEVVGFLLQLKMNWLVVLIIFLILIIIFYLILKVLDKYIANKLRRRYNAEENLSKPITRFGENFRRDIIPPFTDERRVREFTPTEQFSEPVKGYEGRGVFPSDIDKYPREDKHESGLPPKHIKRDWPKFE